VLGPCRSQGQRELWILPRTRQAEMSDDPLNHSRVLDASKYYTGDTFAIDGGYVIL